MKYPTRVKDSTTTTGTGTITCANTPPPTYRALGAEVDAGDTFPYGLFHATLNEWEIGTGTMLTETTFTRAPINSSNGDALVNFSAGTKELLCVLGGGHFASVERTTQVTFAAAIPLGTPGHAYMADKTVNAPLTFTAAAGAVRGALVYLRLIADGVNLPNFSAFKEWGGSSGYDNRNGIVNQVQFFYDGADLFYSASQAVGAVPVAVPDTTAPTLSTPSGSATGPTTASGSVTTNEANGSLYYLFSTASTATAAAVKAGSTQAITTTGSKAVSATGLTASTTYYVHFLHRDAAGNDSAVASSASFVTSAVDSTAPVLTSPSGTQTGTTTATVSVTTDEANGTLYALVTTNATETAATVKASGATQAITTTGNKSFNITGLTANTAYFSHFVHRDASGNDSTVANGSGFTTADVAPASNYLRFAQLDHLAESGSGPYTYNGLPGTNGVYNANGGISTQARPASGDCTVSINNAGDQNFLFGVVPVGTTSPAFAAMVHGIWTSDSATGFYAPVNAGSPGAATATQRQSGDVVQLRIVGSTLIVEVARAASPTVFSTVHTFTGVATTSWKFAVNIALDAHAFTAGAAVGLV